MTDAQDTIELPAFGLTLTRGEFSRMPAWQLSTMGARVYASFDDAWWYVSTSVRRNPHTVSEYATYMADSLDVACERLLAEMTPDDVAAIRALGER